MEAPTDVSVLTPREDGVRPMVNRDAPTWAAALGSSGAIKLLVIAALVSWLYWPQYVRCFAKWQTPDWSHGFLIVPFCFYLVNMRRRELLIGRHEGSIIGLFLLIASIVAYFLSIRMKIGYPQPLSLVGVVAGLVLLLRGWRSLWYTAFPIGFFILAIPPPTRLYRQFTQPMQQLAATLSTWALNMFPQVLEVTRRGVNIEYWMAGGRDGAFTVANACSGMRSLMAFVALGLALAYMTPRPTWQRLAMAVFVVPVALLCNILRVIITGSLQMYELKDLAKGTPHTILGLIMFAFGFVLYMGLLWILDHLVVEEQGEPDLVSGGA